MIETKILGEAVGIQRQDVIDKSETTVLPSLNNGVIAGHFKRGRMDKPFKVTSANYRSLLGHDPSNASYLAVEDCFKQGVSELSILRVGQAGNLSGHCAPTTINVRLHESQTLNITTSVNGGARNTLSSPEVGGFELFLFALSALLTDNDGGSIGFSSPLFTSMGAETQPPLEDNGAVILEINGLASDGTVLFYGKPYNIKNMELMGFTGEMPSAFSVDKIVPAQTTIAIYPTEGVMRQADLYYGLDGANDNGDPVFIKSCARAVLAKEATPPQDDITPTYGRRIRTRDAETSRADMLYEYHPENIGNGGENNLNFGNFFADSAYDSQVKGAAIRINKNGWSDWSNPIDFDEINHANSGGYLGISHTTSKSPNFAINMAGVTNIQTLIGRAINEFGNYGIVFEYGDFDS